jgi:hypothetical protein
MLVTLNGRYQTEFPLHVDLSNKELEKLAYNSLEDVLLNKCILRYQIVQGKLINIVTV